MNREEFKKLAEEEFINNTMKHLDSALIFTYIQNLEQKENNLQSKIDKANELIETYKNERDTYKRLAECYINKYNKERSYNNE